MQTFHVGAPRRAPSADPVMVRKAEMRRVRYARQKADLVSTAGMKTGLIRKPVVCVIIGASQSGLNHLIAAGQFPKPIKLSPRCAVWPAADVHAWVDARIAAARAAA